MVQVLLQELLVVLLIILELLVVLQHFLQLPLLVAAVVLEIQMLMVSMEAQAVAEV